MNVEFQTEMSSDVLLTIEIHVSRNTPSHNAITETLETGVYIHPVHST